MSPDAAPSGAVAPPQGRAMLGLLTLAAGVGLAVSLAAWGFLELIHQVQVGVFEGLPKDLGYANGAPWWWSLPVCGVAGLLLALASGLGIYAVRLAREDAPPAVVTVVAAAGSFAAMSFLFEAPVIAAVILIEATGL